MVIISLKHLSENPRVNETVKFERVAGKSTAVVTSPKDDDECAR